MKHADRIVAARSSTLLAALVSLALTAAPAALTSDLGTFSDISFGTFGSSITSSRSPDIAYERSSDTYLAVWVQPGTTNLYPFPDVWCLWAREIHGETGPGRTYRVHGSYNEIRTPKVCAIPSTQRFLIAYEEGGKIFVRTCDVEEEVVSGETRLNGLSAVDIARNPCVAARFGPSPEATRALIAWERDDVDQYIDGRIMGRSVTIPPSASQAPIAWQPSFEISDAPGHEPAIAAGVGAFEPTVVVWVQEDEITGWDDGIWGTTVSLLASPLPEIGPKRRLSSTLDFPATAYRSPDVAGDGEEYLLVWETDALSGDDVRARFISSSGIDEFLSLEEFVPLGVGSTLDPHGPSVTYAGDKAFVAYSSGNSTGLGIPAKLRVDEVHWGTRQLCRELGPFTATTDAPFGMAFIDHADASLCARLEDSSSASDRVRLVADGGEITTAEFEVLTGGPVTNLGGGTPGRFLFRTGPAALGVGWFQRLSIQHVPTPSGPALLAIARDLPGTAIGPYELVSLAEPYIVTTAPSIDLAVPCSPSLEGLRFRAQGIVLDPAGPIEVAGTRIGCSDILQFELAP